MVTETQQQRKVLLKYLVRYSDKVTMCGLCGQVRETTKQALEHFTKLELLEIEAVEKAKAKLASKEAVR